MITIEPEKLHKALVDLRAEGYDFFRSLTGMDWDEEGLGVIYHIEKTSTGENKVVKTVTANLENPELPSVCDIWKAAELNEREVYDFFGIHFIGHPDMRRLFLREDWVGHPIGHGSIDLTFESGYAAFDPAALQAGAAVGDMSQAYNLLYNNYAKFATENELFGYMEGYIGMIDA